jgi:hypothetical protein
MACRLSRGHDRSAREQERTAVEAVVAEGDAVDTGGDGGRDERGDDHLGGLRSAIDGRRPAGSNEALSTAAWRTRVASGPLATNGQSERDQREIPGLEMQRRPRRNRRHRSDPAATLTNRPPAQPPR